MLREICEGLAGPCVWCRLRDYLIVEFSLSCLLLLER